MVAVLIALAKIDQVTTVTLRSSAIQGTKRFYGLKPSVYEKGYPGYPGIPLTDLKPVGLCRHPEALRGSL